MSDHGENGSTKTAQRTPTKGTPKATAEQPQNDAKKTSRLLQTDLPRRSLRDALRVPQAIVDNYGSHPTAPHDVALALDMSPTSGSWRDLTGAAQGYGLVKGAYNAERIALDDVGRRAVAPMEEGDDAFARADAALKPKVFGDFFRKYDRSKFPPDHIAKNVLHQQYGVPNERLDAVLSIIKENGQFVGFIRETKTGPFVALDKPEPIPVRVHSQPESSIDGDDSQLQEESFPQEAVSASTTSDLSAPPLLQEKPFKVFITHGKNLEIVDQVKDILGLYDIDYEAAVEEETAAIPVPQKVMEAMRRCSAGVMVVTADEAEKVGDVYTINTNVLIEIGTAFVLYDQRVILVWDKRLKVPSNLQGLYRLDFEGRELSFSSGTKLAKAVKSLRK